MAGGSINDFKINILVAMSSVIPKFKSLSGLTSIKKKYIYKVFFSLSQAFGSILDLVPLAESVVKLNAVCMHCFKDAAFTKRLGEEKKVGKKSSNWLYFLWRETK